MLNGGLFGLAVGPGLSSPAVRPRDASDTRMHLGLRDLSRSSGGRGKTTRRKSQIIEEEDEEEGGEAEDDDEEVIEEVDVFEPIDLARGERVHSVTLWDDTAEATAESDNGREQNVRDR